MELHIFKKSENIGKHLSGTPSINVASHGQITFNKSFIAQSEITQAKKVTLAKSGKEWYLAVGIEDGFDLNVKNDKSSLAFSNAIIAQEFLKQFKPREIDILNGVAEIGNIRSVNCAIATGSIEVQEVTLYKIDLSNPSINFKK